MILGISMVSATEDADNSTLTDADLDEVSENDGLAIDGDNEEIISIDEDSKLGTTYSVKTTITVNSVTYNEGSDYSFTANVKANNGMEVPGTVTFKHDKEFARTLDSKGTAKISFIGNQIPGEYSWTATYNGGSIVSGKDTYKFSTSKTTFKLKVVGNARLTSENYVFDYKSGEKFRIDVRNNHNGNPLIDKKIKLLIYDSSNQLTTSYYYTNEYGACEETINKIPGDYRVVASVDEEFYNSNVLSFTVTVKKPSVKLIPTKSVVTYGQKSTLKVNVEDSFGNKINEGKVIFKIKGKSYTVNVKNGVATKILKLENAGKIKFSATFSGDNYCTKKINSNVNVKKAPVKIKAYKWISTTKSFANLKSIVKDSKGRKLKEGTVKFKINGKSYNAKVKNGVAIKKVKIKKAKTYKYKSTFSSKNYKTKTSSSKVFVKKTKKYYIIKYRKYSGKISYKQYLKIINAKNNGKYAIVTVKTGKYLTYKEPIYKTVKVKKTKWVYKKVLSYESFYGDGYYDSYSYDLTKYYNKGWKLYGWYDKDYSDGYESYAKLKKKVKYIDTEEVKTGGYKTVKYPYHICLETIEKDGQALKEIIYLFGLTDLETEKELAYIN